MTELMVWRKNVSGGIKLRVGIAGALAALCLILYFFSRDTLFGGVALSSMTYIFGAADGARDVISKIGKKDDPPQ